MDQMRDRVDPLPWAQFEPFAAACVALAQEVTAQLAQNDLFTMRGPGQGSSEDDAQRIAAGAFQLGAAGDDFARCVPDLEQ